VLDVLTAIVLLLAVFLMVRPGSPFYESVRERIADRARDKVIRQSWAAVVATAQPLAEGGGEPDVIEFIDYECPFCRGVQPVIDSAVKAGLRLAIIQLPLGIHPRAKWAALAGLCAATLGRFPKLHEELLSTTAWRTDSLSPTAWPVALAGVQRETQACMADSVTAARLQRHLRIVDSLHITQTPTFISSGGIVRGVPSAASLTALRSGVTGR
jgi:protein-disulfide isomerase